MFDSGSTKSFIKKSLLDQTSHLPIQQQQQQYYLADGNTTFKILGIVEVFIEVDQLQTSIAIGVVESLCVDCILGMDYIEKYQVNLDYKQKQVHIHKADQQVSSPMINDEKNKPVLCRIFDRVLVQPYQERQIKISSSMEKGQMLFTPVSNLFLQKDLITPHSLISVANHVAWITVYNDSDIVQPLYRNEVLGTVSPLFPSDFISTIIDVQPKTTIDEDQTNLSSLEVEGHIEKLCKHVQDQQRRSNLQVILRKHQRLFDTTQVTIAQTATPHAICTGDHPPTASRPYPQSMEKQNATFDIIQQMLKNKQIRSSHSQYSAPVLLIKKRDGSYRFVVDYRKLNSITIQDRYPLPNLEQTLQMVGGHEYYSKLDLRAGYFQIPIREQDKHKTAFTTVHGLYEFNVLAQGLKNSPPSFQRIMSNLLLSCRKFALVYLDDILVYSNSFDQHLQHLNQVLAILNKHQFQLNPEKCDVFQTSVDYLGHTINKAGIKPLQDRIEAILAIPQPTTLKQANAFIGAVGWYKKFVKNFSHIAAPILAVTNLTTKNRHKFKWQAPQRQAFDQLKAAIISEPLFLMYPDPKTPLILATDASDYCIGGVLYQESDGMRQNIYFHSQMLPKEQQKWSTIEKEALAIYYCVMRMKMYLLGREFIIQTDHCPLRDMHKKPVNNRRVDRMSLVLQQYNISEIRHVSGKCNCMADYLTRYSSHGDDDELFDEDYGVVPRVNIELGPKGTTEVQNVVSALASAVTTRARAKAQIQQQTDAQLEESNDDVVIEDDQPPREEGHEFDISKIVEAQKVDQLYQDKIIELEQRPGQCTYVLDDGILYKSVKRGMFTQKVLYVPNSMVEHLLNAYHNSPWAGHFGFRRTYIKLKDKYWWPSMKMKIRDYIRSCIKCQRFNVDRRKPPGLLNPIEPPTGPFQLIGIDFTGPFPITSQGNKYVLAITDYFTKWVIAIPLPNQTAQTTAEALYDHYICIYGVPVRILSDQGTHFNNVLMSAFTQLLGCHHIKSTPYHPATNGAIERFNSTFERQLAKLVDRHINDWDTHVKSITFAYNTGQHATTKFSPYQLQFGRSARLPPDKPQMNFEFPKANDYFAYFQRTMKLYHQQAINNMQQVQKNYKQYFDRNRADPHYQVGDYVFRRIPTPPSKLSPLYSDPMIIIEHQHPTYWIQNPVNQQITQTHVSQLRLCHFNDNSLDQLNQ